MRGLRPNDLFTTAKLQPIEKISLDSCGQLWKIIQSNQTLMDTRTHGWNA